MKARDALMAIDSGIDRQQWAIIGMSAKAAGLDFLDFLHWSETASNFKSTQDCKSAWNSFKVGAVGAGTLYHTAIEHGWHDNSPKDTAAEIEKREAERRRRLAKEKIDLELANRAAIAKAEKLLLSASMQNHPYLIEKHLADVKALVLPDGELIVPMWDSHSKLQGAQIIKLENNEWVKKFIPSMKAKGAMLMLGPKNAPTVIYCEGFATGLSLDIAVRMLRLNASVAVCFSAFNLAHIASLKPKSRGFVFADHDSSGTGQKVAQETGLKWGMSPVMGEDANDYMTRVGIIGLAKLLNDIMRS